MKTRKPRDNEYMIFNEYQRPRIILLNNIKGVYSFMPDDSKTEIVLKSSFYIYNNIGYCILGDFPIGDDSRNRVVEYFIEMFWEVEK